MSSLAVDQKKFNPSIEADDISNPQPSDICIPMIKEMAKRLFNIEQSKNPKIGYPLQVGKNLEVLAIPTAHRIHRRVEFSANEENGTFSVPYYVEFTAYIPGDEKLSDGRGIYDENSFYVFHVKRTETTCRLDSVSKVGAYLELLKKIDK